MTAPNPSTLNHWPEAWSEFRRLIGEEDLLDGALCVRVPDPDPSWSEDGPVPGALLWCLMSGAIARDNLRLAQKLASDRFPWTPRRRLAAAHKWLSHHLASTELPPPFLLQILTQGLKPGDDPFPLDHPDSLFSRVMAKCPAALPVLIQNGWPTDNPAALPLPWGAWKDAAPSDTVNAFLASGWPLTSVLKNRLILGCLAASSPGKGVFSPGWLDTARGLIQEVRTENGKDVRDSTGCTWAHHWLTTPPIAPFENASFVAASEELADLVDWDAADHAGVNPMYALFHATQDLSSDAGKWVLKWVRRAVRRLPWSTPIPTGRWPLEWMWDTTKEGQWVAHALLGLWRKHAPSLPVSSPDNPVAQILDASVADVIKKIPAAAKGEESDEGLIKWVRGWLPDCLAVETVDPDASVFRKLKRHVEEDREAVPAGSAGDEERSELDQWFALHRLVLEKMVERLVVLPAVMRSAFQEHLATGGGELEAVVAALTLSEESDSDPTPPIPPTVVPLAEDCPALAAALARRIAADATLPEAWLKALQAATPTGFENDMRFQWNTLCAEQGWSTLWSFPPAVEKPAPAAAEEKTEEVPASPPLPTWCLCTAVARKEFERFIEKSKSGEEGTKKSYRDVVERVFGTLKSGADCMRPLALAGGVHAALDRLAETFPHFDEVIAHLRTHATLQAHGDGAFWVPPLLLAGGPGIGKTFFLSLLAQYVETDFRVINMESMTAGFMLTGHSASWSNGRQGLIFDHVVDARTANPLILLDELDKASGNQNYPVGMALLGPLEPTTAASYRDEFAPLALDIRRVNWMASANDLNSIYPALRSRFDVIEVPDPDRAARQALARGVYASLRRQSTWGPAVDEVLTDRFLSALVEPEGSARTLRRILQTACARALAAGRATLEPRDLPDGAPPRRAVWDAPALSIVRSTPPATESAA